MYSNQLRPRALGQGEDDFPVAIPGFTPDTAPSPSSGGLDWNSIVNTVLNDVTQIIRPGTSSTHPIYTPTSTAISNTARSLAPVLLLGGLAFLLLKRR